MPTVTSLEALERAAAEFEIGDTRLVFEPSALTEARRSLDSSGLLLLGEVHGVRENPLVIRALMLGLGLTGLALEWPGRGSTSGAARSGCAGSAGTSFLTCQTPARRPSRSDRCRYLDSRLTGRDTRVS